MVQTALGVLVGGTASVFGALAAIVIVPVLAFYLLLDFDIITAHALALVPTREREQVARTAREVDGVLGHFVRGQLTVMGILAALYGIGYMLVGVPLAVPIGLVAGLLSFIPYVGSAVALGLGLLMVTLHWEGWQPLVGVVIVYTVVQALEGLVITPRVVGDKLGLSPVWVLLALMVGGELFGFVGVMLALPAAAIAKVFASHALRRYHESQLYLARASLVPGAPLAAPLGSPAPLASAVPLASPAAGATLESSLPRRRLRGRLIRGRARGVTEPPPRGDTP
jgi:predicted PurR-regulated permease PerM